MGFDAVFLRYFRGNPGKTRKSPGSVSTFATVAENAAGIRSGLEYHQEHLTELADKPRHCIHPKIGLQHGHAVLSGFAGGWPAFRLHGKNLQLARATEGGNGIEFFDHDDLLQIAKQDSEFTVSVQIPKPNHMVRTSRDQHLFILKEPD